MGILQWLGIKSKADRIAEFKARGAIVVDVRSKPEFQSGHAQGSENIPLNNILNRIDYLAKKKAPVITVCRSGARSGRAAAILKSKGIEALNGGPWQNLNH